MVEYVLRDYIGKSIIVFIDDILVYSNTKEEHETLLREVLKTLQDSELYLKTKKCEFFREKVTFLGHVISHNKVEMDPKKIQIIKDWGSLETKKDVQRFLGFANFYRRFIKNFAKIANPSEQIANQYTRQIKSKNDRRSRNSSKTINRSNYERTCTNNL